MDHARRTSAFFLFCAIASTAARSHTVPTPALVWANNKLFGDEPFRVDYKTAELLDLWKDVSGAWGTPKGASEFESEPEDPSIAVVFVGRQLRLQNLGSLESEPVMRPLKEALAGSESSALHPNLQSADDLSTFMESIAESDALDIQVVKGCDSGSNDVDIMTSIKRTLLSDYQGTKVVVICSPNSLEAEMADLGKVTKILDDQAKPYAFVYVSYASAADENKEHMESQKRRLLAAEAEAETDNWVIDYGVCDDLCETQVKFLEAIILALVLIFALGAGLCCTHILDGPSQFEAPEHES